MELLAPAGSESAMIAAVENGADAVYIGGSKFSARRSAKNFSDDDIKRVLEYCRIRGVKVHVAANILIKEKECSEFIDYVGKLNEFGIDALIIQDIGMASKIRKIFPDLPLHASTQLTAASLDAVEFLEEKGFSRIVLSRELTKEEIEYICKNTKAEIEVFAHGALCMCYSGQCLMSSLIGGRSGNRGMCAQPCRLPYELADGMHVINKGYLLSPKDLSLIDELKSLKDAGVTSLKIEGRLKRPEYVAAVTQTYRKVLDSGYACSERDRQILADAFNRSGFTKGYYTGKTGLGMMSIHTPGNVAENALNIQRVNTKKIKVDVYIQIRYGETAEMTLTDSDFNCVYVRGDIKAEKAVNKPLEKERITEQISKFGNTPFEPGKAEVEVEEGISLPVSQINKLRRDAVAELERIRSKKEAYRSFKAVGDDIEYEDKRLKAKILSAKIHTFEQARACIKNGVKRIYAPSEICEKIKKYSAITEVITILPPVWREKNKKDYYISDGVLVSNIGELKPFAEYPLFGDTRLNVFSSETVKFYGFLKSVAVSEELNIKELSNIKAYTPLEAVVYGRQQLMVCENCVAKMNKSCGKSVYLKDRRKEEFPIMCAPGCYSVILNSKPLYMADKMKELEKLPIDIYRFEFTDESEKQCEDVLKSYRDNVNTMKENSFTRGHYFRGVE